MSTLAPLSVAQVCADTPMVDVRDNRGLSVRTLQYNRQAPADTAHQLIRQQRYGVLGELISRIDPRLFAEQQLNASVLPNFRYHCSLSGKVLLEQSQDAGDQAVLYDIENAPVWQEDSRARIKRFAYDVLHRLTTVVEQDGPSAPERISERNVYGESEANATLANGRGQLVRNYHTAGLNAVPRYSCTGQPLLLGRGLLSDPLALSDWQGDESQWARALDAEQFSTGLSYNALDEVVKTVDAKGNQQHQRRNIAGQLASTSLLLTGQATERPMLTSILYSAAGQVLREVAGNGVISDYQYEPQTQRLNRLLTRRPVHSGRETLLQDLNYSYDPVGNILSILNAAIPTSFYNNQRIEPTNDYQYDALYQLLRASGRENANAGQQGQGLPAPQVPVTADPNQYSNYTRFYTYDRGGNLTQIRHQGSTNYTLDTVVSLSSNHAVQQSGHLLPSDVDAYFDACGNLTQLAPGQPLHWDGRNQLQRVTQVARPGGEDDAEHYQYDGGGQRVRKTSRSQTSGTQRSAEVIYLPGLELRRTRSTSGGSSTTVEDLQVISAGSAGRQQMRVLHWDIGRPVDIANDQLRGSLDNQIGSSVLELDQDAHLLTVEEYFPYGGTAVWSGNSTSETKYKFVRYSGKELDATGLYYYGYRYYAPWLGRWINPDPAGTADGLNLYQFVKSNPVGLFDPNGLAPKKVEDAYSKMLTQGTDWAAGFPNPDDKTYAGFQHKAASNLAALRTLALNHREDTFVQGIRNEPAYAVHFTGHNIQQIKHEREVGVVFRSRLDLERKGIVFATENTADEDLNQFATDDFAFFSFELGDEPKKNASRFGQHRYRIPLETALTTDSGPYAHMAANDILNPEYRPIDLITSPEKKPRWLRTGEEVLFDAPIKNQLTGNYVTAPDLLFPAENIQEAMALSIVKDIRGAGINPKRIYQAENSTQRDSIVNSFYRPQVLFPNRLALKKGNYSYARTLPPPP